MTLRERVEPIIASVLEKNRLTPCELRGGAFCASFERLPDGEPWVQVKTGVLNIFYPSDEEPLQTIRPRLSSLPHDTVCAAWEPWRYATLECQFADAASLAVFVEELFVRFYEFPSDTEVLSEVFDMRSEG